SPEGDSAMMRRTLTIVTTMAMTGVLTAMITAQQTKPMSGHDMGAMKAGGDMTMMTKAQKIANAASAAPASISAKATVLDYPAKEGMAPEVLRAGTNGWSCFPDMPDTKGNDPLCIDEPWMKWLDAYLTKKTPQIPRVGIGYMTAPGGGWQSNTDP